MFALVVSRILSLCILVPMTTNLHSVLGKHPPFAIKIQWQAVRFLKKQEKHSLLQNAKCNCNFLMCCPPLSVMCFSSEWRESSPPRPPQLASFLCRGWRWSEPQESIKYYWGLLPCCPQPLSSSFCEECLG